MLAPKEKRERAEEEEEEEASEARFRCNWKGSLSTLTAARVYSTRTAKRTDLEIRRSSRNDDHRGCRRGRWSFSDPRCLFLSGHSEIRYHFGCGSTLSPRKSISSLQPTKILHRPFEITIICDRQLRIYISRNDCVGVLYKFFRFLNSSFLRRNVIFHDEGEKET